MSKATVYLAGKITGDPDYKDKFAQAEKKLTAADFIVVNPALLPQEGLSYAACIRISSAMMDECDAVCLLADWEESPGAQYEYERAKLCGKRIYFMRDLPTIYDSTEKE